MEEISKPEKDTQAAMAREQVNLALKHLPTMQLTSFLVALILAYTVRNIAPRENIVAWLVMIIVIVTSRIIFYYRFARIRDLAFHGEYWKKAYLLLALASGLLWGLSAFIILPADNFNLIALFVLVIASLSAATTVSHSSLRLGPAAWMGPALLLYAVRCFVAGGTLGYTIGILIIIYFLTLLRYSFTSHEAITASIALRFENLKLLEEVQQSEERFRLLFQLHSAVMLLIDPESGAIVDANAAAERFYGCPVDRLTGSTMHHIDLTPSSVQQTERMRAARRECNLTIAPHRLTNGEVRTVEVHSSPIQTTGRTLLFSIIHDVTERSRTEERLRESEASYRNLFNSMTDAVFIMDESGAVLDVNKGAENMYGRPRGYFLDNSEASPAAPAETERAVLHDAVRRAYAGEPRYVEFQGVRSDGTEFPLEVRLVPTAYRGRRAVIAAARDISERKRAEAELIRAQKLEAIGVLASGIAHDFNNLLQGVFGYLTVAKRKIENRERVALMLDKMEKALLMSVNLTTQLLAFSQVGRPVKSTLDLAPVIRSAARFALSGSRALCRFSFDEELWPVQADEGQLGQVIQNIVLNADQSMPGGGVVTIAARNVDLSGAPATGVPGPGTWVEIRVLDTGVGIPGERLPRIFEPYFTTKENRSGLGLATAYAIMKNHGGMIEVASTVNKGSTFTVWLPAGAPVPDAPRGRDAPAPLPRGKILVMDDEEVVRDSVGEMLQTLGQDVEIAADGASALELYTKARTGGAPFDVVILDVTIRGGMGGRETVEKLREFDPGVTAVVSSGYSDDPVVSNCAAYGFRAFLHKPFTLENLQAVLGRLMKEK